jgi:flagellar biosynthesis protein FlhG
VIAVTSGKGGVGKTNIVANLGFALSRSGQRVMIWDADLGLGNMDILLGVTPRYNLSHVLSGEKRMREITVAGPGEMTILPASSGVQELTRLSDTQKGCILSEMNGLLTSFDVMLIDTGAGISSNVIYCNTMAREILVVVTPEPTAITDAYALMKVLSLRHGVKHFWLLVNMVKSGSEADEVFRQLQLVTGRFLDIRLTHMGAILADDHIPRSVRKQRIVADLFPAARASRDFTLLAETVLSIRNIRPDPPALLPVETSGNPPRGSVTPLEER